MIPEIIRYKVPAAQADEFVQAYAKAGAVLRQSPNCHAFELLRSSKDAELYLLTLLWDSGDGHLQGFRKSALFPQFLALIRPYIPNILEMEHYEYTAVKWQRDPEG